jgi:general transcription factor 3C polypeptide 3 (transcription factor C subunit 4)
MLAYLVCDPLEHHTLADESLACALEARDEFVICKTTRLFMQSSHYVSEASRLYAALCRICLATTNWFNAGPSQKYILRQIKAIDYHLLEDSERHANHFRERAKPLKRRNEATPDKMDVALIMLYGQMMYAGTSYTYGLNYFFRALALEPQNPMVNLCIGLSYIQQALKRQSENRHQLVMQGIAFLNIYYDIRKKSEQLVERQEAEYNMGRAYHLLGLSHLAEPYYTRVLKIAEERGPSTTHEAYEKVAAYNLRIMLTLAGDGQGAKAVGKKWLVL